MAIDCGIDIGSTNLKVVLVDEGRAIYVRSVPTPREHDEFGTVTNAVALVFLLEDMIIEGWKQCGGGKPLRSITTAGVGEDGLGMRSDLSPAGPSIPWFDRRAENEAAELRLFGDFSDRTGIPIASDRTVAKWAWLRRHRPVELDESENWIALTDYPAVWWSGQPFMSVSLAPRTACFDVISRSWEGRLLEAVGAPPLPMILDAGSALGGVRGGRLRESGAASSRTTVTAGGHDHPIAASVFRRLDPTGLIDSLGTANLMYGELSEGTLLPKQDDLAFSIPPAGERHLACLGVVELSSALSSALQQGNAFWSLLAHPTLPGKPPDTPEQLRETGPNPRSLRRNLERATLTAKQRLSAMREAGVPSGKIYTSGGWSRWQSFTELRASIFGQPVHVVGDLELTAMGAALFGAQATAGTNDSPLRAADIKTIDPVADWAPLYDRLFSQLSDQATAGRAN